METPRRPNIRGVQINRRHGALCAGKRVRIRQLKRQALALFNASVHQIDEEEARKLRNLGVILVAIPCRLKRDRTILPPTIRGRTPVIDDITDSDAWTNSRSRKLELRRLFRAFNFLEWIRLGNGGRYPSESAFLLLIRRMRYPGRWQDLQVKFGREYTQLSRIFNDVIDWVYENHLHRVTHNLEFFSSRFPTMCMKIRGERWDGMRGRQLHRVHRRDAQKELPPRGGSRVAGANVRRPPLRSWPCLAVCCVCSWDAGDLRTGNGATERCPVAKPKRIERQTRGRAGGESQFKVYGDAAYPVTSHVDRGFRGANLTDAQRTYNRELSKVRLGCRWSGSLEKSLPFSRTSTSSRTSRSGYSRSVDTTP